MKIFKILTISFCIIFLLTSNAFAIGDIKNTGDDFMDIGKANAGSTTVTSKTKTSAGTYLPAGFSEVAGTNLDKYTEDELIRLDAKKIEKEDIKYVIAQVNTVSIPDILKRKEKIEQEINKEILAKGLSLFVFVITDIINSN